MNTLICDFFQKSGHDQQKDLNQDSYGENSLLRNDDKNNVDMEERKQTNKRRKRKHKKIKYIYKKRKNLNKKRKITLSGETINRKLKTFIGEAEQNKNINYTESIANAILDNQKKEEYEQIAKLNHMRAIKLQQLTDEQKRIVQQTFQTAEKNTQSTVYGKLRASDILRLKPRGWLNDEIVNSYGEMLEDRNKIRFNNGECGMIILMNSFFFTKLTSNAYDYNVFNRWISSKIKKIDVFKIGKTMFDLDKIIVPINMNDHWFCMCINIRKKRIEFYNSINTDHIKLYDRFKRCIEDEINNKKLIMKEEWSYYTPSSIPLQKNNFDCGVFTCKFMDWLCDDLNPDFEQEDVHGFRLKIAYELITNKLL
ncbi:hypothetical protein RFI_21992 [Reticulomyxa filosa]|uniref:Ubiquitin-like protease family profile domain-containing protein n=1 Tax=Reticulomyxa filosa TaxID=46433 RepID=X6MPP6_RETFI|nr:hypothetical protein RFI_21992 [Reticulomyxa filosa]|eukprot:ETO15372.1 hypothetical protein RFI_21992 [Reticulomyxa filosa]